MALLRNRYALLGPDAEPSEPPVSELFHENTKLQPDAPIGGLFPTVYSEAESAAMVSVGKRYHRAEHLPLPELPRAGEAGSFQDLIERRRTCRSFDPRPVSLEAAARLLQLTGGVTDRRRTEGGLLRVLRAAPSAGALYPIEIYLGVRHVQGVDPGLYHFAPRERRLERLKAGDPTEALARACHYRESLEQAAMVVIFVGVFERTRRKYGERGYRYVLLEAGHIAQNLCLASAALDLGCLNVCGFFDDRLNDLLQLDGTDEAALYVAYVGHPRRQGAAEA